MPLIFVSTASNIGREFRLGSSRLLIFDFKFAMMVCGVVKKKEAYCRGFLQYKAGKGISVVFRYLSIIWTSVLVNAVLVGQFSTRDGG